MSYKLSIHSTKAFKEVLLPAVDNTDYSIILSDNVFRLSSDIEIHMEVIDGNWYFVPSDTYSIEETIKCYLRILMHQ